MAVVIFNGQVSGVFGTWHRDPIRVLLIGGTLGILSRLGGSDLI